MRHHTSLTRASLFRRAASLTGVCTLFAGLAIWGFPSGPGLSSAVGGVPSCATANLDVWLNTEGSGAAGSTYYNLNFTNLSSHTCTLRGYPGVSGVTQAGIQLGSAAGRNAEHAPALITLTSAKTANGFEDVARSTSPLRPADRSLPQDCASTRPVKKSRPLFPIPSSLALTAGRSTCTPKRFRNTSLVLKGH
jgi:hypothetical protein